MGILMRATRACISFFSKVLRDALTSYWPKIFVTLETCCCCFLGLDETRNSHSRARDTRRDARRVSHRARALVGLRGARVECVLAGFGDTSRESCPSRDANGFQITPNRRRFAAARRDVHVHGAALVRGLAFRRGRDFTRARATAAALHANVRRVPHRPGLLRRGGRGWSR
jgi:hypothetical protein